MTGTVAFARALRLAVVVVSLALSACDDGFFLHPPAPATAALIFTYAPALVQPIRASAVADRARIQVSRGTTVMYDSTHALPAGTGDVRLRIELELQSETEMVDVIVELLEGTRVLARSGQSVELTQGRTTAAALTPDVVADNLAVGDGHACYLDPTGRAYCWGRNHVGQLGIGTQVGSSRPVAVQTALRFAAIDAATYHTCALTFDGEAYCWGSNAGQLGDGTKTPRSTPAAVGGGLRFASITTGVVHTCGLTTAGEAYCWGQNGQGQLGSAGVTEALTPQLVQGSVRTFDALSAGFWKTCGVAAQVTYCWGVEIGGGFAVRDIPTAAPAGSPAFTSMALGTIHSCALTSAGAAYCWGTAGTLGTGQMSASTTPVAVSGGHSFASLSVSRANSFHAGTTCALTFDGRAFCWGFNHAGQLGAATAETCPSTFNLTLPCSTVPLAVEGGLRFTTIQTGGSTPVQERSGATCGLSESGVVYCWGNNEDGVLGQGDATSRSAPTRVGAPVPPPVLTSIALEPASLTLAAGDSAMVAGRGADQGGHFVPMLYAWTSSDTTRLIVRLAANARATSVRVVARAAGPATLTASAEGVSASMNVIVN